MNCLRVVIAAVVCATGLTLACSGKIGNGSGDGGGGGSGGGNDASACTDYFEAVYAGNCPGNLTPPNSELTRIQGRFQTLCAAALTLPGVSISASSLEACVSALKSDGCQALEDETGPCSFNTGTLAAQASCLSDDQCLSGDCTAGSEGPDGGTLACGMCTPVTGLGQACGNGQSCGPNAACNYTGTSGTCTAITSAAEGAPCTETARCDGAGLYCNSMQICSAQKAAGAACDEENACLPPLVCPLTGTTGTCTSPGAAGATCGDSSDCQSGLGCSETTHTCAAVTWVAGGQPCSDTQICLVGGCTTTGTTDSGTCPTVIPDGQPCDTNAAGATSTCDTFAQCLQGTCVLGYATCP